MKICHIISAFKRYDPRIFWKFCRTLAKNGHEVILLCNDELPPEKTEGVLIIPSGFKYSSRIKRIIFARALNFKKAIEIDADLYQIHDPEFIPVGLKLIKAGKKVIYDSHEDFPRQILEKEWVPKYLRKFLSFVAGRYLHSALKKFDAVLTVTPHIAESLKKANEKTYVITNYPLVEESPLVIEESEYCRRKNVLCYTGTVYRSSLQENIIASLEGLNDVEYKIIGNIEESYRNMIRNISPGNVHIIDFMPREDLFRYYEKVTIGVAVFDYSPNLGYKQGSLGVNKIFEYMYFGLPVICTDFVLWQEIIEKYQCGILVNPKNIPEIKKAISFLVVNRKEAYRMGQNGRKAVLQEYNWNGQEKIYMDVVNAILNSTHKHY